MASVYSKAAISNAANKVFTLDLADIGTEWQPAKKIRRPTIRNIADLETLKLGPPKTKSTSYRIKGEIPFKVGSKYCVYHGTSNSNTQKVVLKYYKSSGGEDAMAFYQTRLKIYVTAVAYTSTFNQEDSRLRDDLSLEFTPLNVIQFQKLNGPTSDALFVAEVFIEGEIVNLGLDSSVRFYNLLQAFSHYTWVKSERTLLINDFQGPKLPSRSRIMMTDPVIHSSDAPGKYGVTDLGREGIENFFKTHVCSQICDSLKITQTSV